MSTHREPRRGTASRVGSWLVNIVMVLATVAGIGYLAPSLFGYERYVITGGSMSGTFEKGSIAFEERVPVEDVKVGDVITYLPPADSGTNHLVTHRVISDTVLPTGQRQLQTQGDANPDPDPWTFALTGDTQPVVRTTVPLAGWIFVALADRETRMIAIGVPAGLIALASLVELGRGIGGARRDRREKREPAVAAASASVEPARMLVHA
ncbi:signal peptidase I [Aeromicrobium sp. CFBP 8757]|uniref:signal peptidase I n=1 Tax=Aeromicrobium sp. CFBP 8757 TaxID=2775288 RepID=UPI0018D9C5D4|nr:signal peptidase I [Aeromicrobium sp. CFBP 8757]